MDNDYNGLLELTIHYFVYFLRVVMTVCDATSSIVKKTHGRIQDLQVSLKNGVLEITGSCNSHHVKQIAQEAVRGFGQPVLNKIIVRRKT